MRLIYIAGPFRSANDNGVEANIRRAEALGLEVAKLGASPVIPHANTRSLHHHVPESFMLEATLELMRRCDALVLVEGWQDSQGTRDEMCEAHFLGLPVFYTLFGLKNWLEGLK
jgi:nucleoside 2-deoxyribosyltransferase